MRITYISVSRLALSVADWAVNASNISYSVLLRSPLVRLVFAEKSIAYIGFLPRGVVFWANFFGIFDSQPAQLSLRIAEKGM